MILLITNKQDLTTDFVVRALRDQSAEFTRFNTEDLLRDWRVDWRTGGWKATPKDGGSVIESSQVSSVYYRRPLPPRLVDGTATEAADFILRESRALLDGLYSSLHNAAWISEPRAIIAAEDKLQQLKIAEDLGLRIPATLVTNDPRSSLEFSNQFERVIIKPLSSGTLTHEPLRLSYTTELPKDADLLRIETGPHLLQERIPKTADLRVTVVDEKVFACKIHSQTLADTSLDWRRASALELGIPHERLDLDSETATACVELVRILGLRFGAIDLAESHSGYVFLEINPNGQWAWLETRAGLPISAAIANALAADMRRRVPA